MPVSNIEQPSARPESSTGSSRRSGSDDERPEAVMDPPRRAAHARSCASTGRCVGKPDQGTSAPWPAASAPTLRCSCPGRTVAGYRPGREIANDAGGHPAGSLSPLVAHRQEVGRDLAGHDRPPLDVEGSAIAEQRPPAPVAHGDLDAEAVAGVVVPFADLGDAGESEREGEGDAALVEALLAGAQPQTAALVDGELEVDREMLMGPQVVDDAAPLPRMDHEGIEAPPPADREGADPGDGLAPVGVEEGVVLDREGHLPPALGEHDAAPAPEVEEGEGVGRAVPDLVHDPAAHGGQAVGAAEAEAALDLRVQAREVGAEDLLV